MNASLPTALHFVLLVFGGWVNREQQKVIDYLLEENRVLRELLGGRRLRLDDDQRRRLAIKGKAVGRTALRHITGIVTPDTILRWYQRLVARKYDGSKKRGPGRPRTKAEVVELVVTMAKSNPTWGYTRIRDALAHLGHDIGRNTIKRILGDHALEPAPERSKRKQTHDLEDLPCVALGSDRGGRLLHRRGADLARVGPIFRLFRHRLELAQGRYRRHYIPAERGMDTADRAKPHRPVWSKGAQINK